MYPVNVVREFIVKNFNQNLDGEIHLWSALLDQPDERIIQKIVILNYLNITIKEVKVD